MLLHDTGWGKLGQEETWSRLLRKAEVSIATSGECEDNVRTVMVAGWARSCCECFSCSTPALVLTTSSPSHLVNRWEGNHLVWLNLHSIYSFKGQICAGSVDHEYYQGVCQVRSCRC